MEKVSRHPIIPDHIVEDIPKLHTAIDTVLNLHYASHIVDPSLDKILHSTSQFIKKKVDISNLLTILSIDKSTYKIYRRNGYSDVNIVFPENLTLADYNRISSQRKVNFVHSLNKWVERNPKATKINIYNSLEDIIDTVQKKVGFPSKITKPASKQRVKLVSEMKNESSRFKFKERDEEIEKLKSNGLSLLERIKLKEKRKKEAIIITPEMRYHDYLRGKSVPVYDIIFQICKSDLQNTQSKSYSIKSMIKIIKDSFAYPIGESEVEDILRYISEKFEKKNFTILEANGVSVLKVTRLDRKEDINILKKVN